MSETKKTSKKIRAVIYARVSSTTDRQNTERQVSDLTQYASAMGYVVERIFEEKISGAKKNVERHGLNDALEFSFTNDIDILLCSELSRVGRNAFETLETIKRMIDNGLNLYLQKEQFTLFDRDGRPSVFAPIMLATLSTCAELERENIRFRLNSGRSKAISEGKRMGRPEGSLNKHPEESKERLAEKYRDVLKELRRGTSVRRTARFCNTSMSTVQRLKKTFQL